MELLQCITLVVVAEELEIHLLLIVSQVVLVVKVVEELVKMDLI
jgi:hypothetical protein